MQADTNGIAVPESTMVTQNQCRGIDDCMQEQRLALHTSGYEPARRNGQALMQVVMDTSTPGGMAKVVTEIAQHVSRPDGNASRVMLARRAVDQWHKTVASHLERSMKLVAPLASSLLSRSQGQAGALMFLMILLAGAIVAVGFVIHFATGHSGRSLQTNDLRAVADRRKWEKDWQEESSCGSLTSDSQLSLAHHPRGSAGIVDRGEVGPPSSSELRREFCPALVVPRGHECILSVPKPRQDQNDSFDVEDLQGNPLIRAEVMPAARATGNTIVKLKALFQPPGSAVSAGTTLAFCKVTQVTTDSGSNVQVYNGRNELFAHLSKVISASQLQTVWDGHGQLPGRTDFRPCYLLSGIKSSPKVLFQGNFYEDAVTVTNELQELMADTEPVSCAPGGRRCFKLRVSSNVDVGFVLCGLLSIAQMEAQ